MNRSLVSRLELLARSTAIKAWSSLWLRRVGNVVVYRCVRGDSLGLTDYPLGGFGGSTRRRAGGCRRSHPTVGRTFIGDCICVAHDSTEGSTCTCIDFLGRSLAVGAARYHSLGEGTGGGKGGPNHGGGARRSGGPIPRERVWGALGRPRGDGEACRRTLTGGGGGRGGGPGG